MIEIVREMPRSLQPIGMKNIFSGVQRAGLPALKPSDVPGSNLKLWLNGDASTVSTVSGKVDTWSDQSGNGNNATQTTAANRFVYNSSSSNGFNGRPTVTMSRANSTWMACDGISSVQNGLAQPCTIIAAYRMVSTNSGHLIAFGNNSGFTGHIWFGIATPVVTLTPLLTDLRDDATPTPNVLQISSGGPGAGATDFLPHVASLVTDGASVTMYLDGAIAGVTTSCTSILNKTVNQVTLGAIRGPTLPLDAETAEIAVWNRVLTATERRGVEAGFRLKYGTP